MSGRHVRIDINSQRPPDKSERSNPDFAASAVALGRATLLVLQQQEHVHNAVLLVSERCVVVEFLAPAKHVPWLLNILWSLGIGRVDCPHSSRLSIQHLLTCVPPLRSRSVQSVRRYSTRDRRAIDEILSTIEGSSHLTFDFLLMVCCAALIAGIGVVTDSSITVVASMLISPLMSPILLITLGLSLHDWKMVRRGVFNEVVACLVAFGWGLLSGLVAAPIIVHNELGSEWVLHSQEMLVRGDPWSLLPNTLLAVPAGIAVTLCVTSDGSTVGLVGVAISASLLPPLVNSGICLMLATVWQIYDSQGELGDYNATRGARSGTLRVRYDEQFHDDTPGDFFGYAAVSMALYLLNLLTIVLIGYMTFQWKRVTPDAPDYHRDVWGDSYIGDTVRETLALEHSGEDDGFDHWANSSSRRPTESLSSSSPRQAPPPTPLKHEGSSGIRDSVGGLRTTDGMRTSGAAAAAAAVRASGGNGGTGAPPPVSHGAVEMKEMAELGGTPSSLALQPPAQERIDEGTEHAEWSAKSSARGTASNGKNGMPAGDWLSLAPLEPEAAGPCSSADAGAAPPSAEAAPEPAAAPALAGASPAAAPNRPSGRRDEPLRDRCGTWSAAPLGSSSPRGSAKRGGSGARLVSSYSGPAPPSIRPPQRENSCGTGTLPEL